MNITTKTESGTPLLKVWSCPHEIDPLNKWLSELVDMDQSMWSIVNTFYSVGDARLLAKMISHECLFY